MAAPQWFQAGGYCQEALCMCRSGLLASGRHEDDVGTRSTTACGLVHAELLKSPRSRRRETRPTSPFTFCSRVYVRINQSVCVSVYFSWMRSRYVSEQARRRDENLTESWFFTRHTRRNRRRVTRTACGKKQSRSLRAPQRTMTGSHWISAQSRQEIHR